MPLAIVGAGVGRTGTHSLKLALERLLGGTCHHMIEVVLGPGQLPAWTAIARGEPADWHAVLDGYVASCDFPSACYWPELAAAYPDALVLLSVRESAEAWYRSASRTIFEAMRARSAEGDEWMTAFVGVLAERFSADFEDEAAMVEAYERHNAAVRAGVPAERLFEWQPGDGWAPICERLGVPVPDEPFPVTNSTDEFRAMAGLDRLS